MTVSTTTLGRLQPMGKHKDGAKSAKHTDSRETHIPAHEGPVTGNGYTAPKRKVTVVYRIIDRLTGRG